MILTARSIPPRSPRMQNKPVTRIPREVKSSNRVKLEKAIKQILTDTTNSQQ